MPYKIVKNGEAECVHKEDASGGAGEKKHCYSGPKAHSQAVAYMRALYAAEGSTKEIEEEQALDSELFPCMVEGVMESDLGLNEKMEAIKVMADELTGQQPVPVEEESEEVLDLLDDSDFPLEEAEKAKRADVSPADKKRAVAEYGNAKFADATNKKYPLTGSNGALSEEKIRAAWSYINMPRNSKKYADGGAAIKRKIVAAWKKKIDPKGPPEAASKKELSFDEIVSTVVEKVKDLFGLSKPDKSEGFMTFKEADGSYAWIARYSNNYRDQDNPPEIISSASHQRFVERVEKGLSPLPELWIWHVKEWRIGKADWVTYDLDSGFALAGGHSLPGTEPVFELLSNIKGIKVSHGMPNSTIVRDATDKSILIEHETREISPLPGWAAANKLTGFVVLENDVKEADMAIPADKREKLIKEWGITDELLTKIEAANANDSQKAKDEGLQQKEAETPAVPVAPATPAEAEKQPAPAAEVPAANATTAAEPDETTKAITVLADQIKLLQGEIATLKEQKNTQEEAVKEVVRETPLAAIFSMFGDQAKSVVGSPDAAVDGRTTLAKSKPATPKENVEGRTLVPFLNEILAGK